MKSTTYIIILLSIIINSIILCQDFKGIHQKDMEAFGLSLKEPSLFNPDGKDIIPLSINKIDNLSHTIFGYLPDWEYQYRSYLRYDLVTHIGCFDFVVASNGNITNPSFWPWTDIINSAHNNGVKVIMVAVNFKPIEQRNIIKNSTARQNFFNNVKSIIQTFNLDGVNIDFEGLYTSIRGDTLNWFLADLTNFIHTNLPGKEVSFAGPAVNWGGWKFDGLANSCDYIVIMGYDYYGSWSNTTGPSSPLIGGNYNITKTLTNTSTGYGAVTSSNPQKLVLALPYYGNRWQTVNQSPGCSTIAHINSPRFYVAEPEAITHEKIWSSTYQTPWYTYSSDGNYYQVWYDDRESIELKLDLAKSYQLKGVGMWAMFYDRYRFEFWDLLQEKFYTGPPLKPEELFIIRESSTSLRVNFNPDSNATGYYILMSTNGINFSDSVYSTDNNVLIPNLYEDTTYYIKVRAHNLFGYSAYTEVLAAVPSTTTHKILIVNGFDRIQIGNTYDFIRLYDRPIKQRGYPFSSTSNEAVMTGKVNLDDYEVVIWIIGEESTLNFTFTDTEQSKVENYLKQGGKLFISGSEIGWDLDRSDYSSPTDTIFYRNYLKARYYKDAPFDKKQTYYTVEPIAGQLFEVLSAFSFDNGTHGTYDVDYPDAIFGYKGGTAILKFQGVNTTDGVAGISYSGLFNGGTMPAKLVYLTFPFETIYPESTRINIMSKIFDFFEMPSTLKLNLKIFLQGAYR